MAWKRICGVDEIPTDDLLRVKVDGQDLAVCGSDGRYFVFVDRCTHEDVPLSDGFLEGCTIECPRHGSRFDLATGRCLSPPATEDLKTFAAKIQDGELHADLPG
jgi:nitrite reductase/ring-hydroxylating ferredoxin subunit